MKTVIRVHRSGIVYICVSIVFGVISVNSGNNYHYLATAVMLGFMLASGIAGRGNIRSAEISIEYPDEVYAKTPFLLTVEVRNQSKRIPIYLIEVNVDGEKLMFPTVAAGETCRLRIYYSFPRRGINEIKDVRLFSVYPFNLFTRFWDVCGDLSSVVFPAPEKPAGETIYVPPEGGLGDDAARGLRADGDIIGVRPYISGDNMRQIHWKSSARTGKISSRVFDDDSSGGGKTIDLERLILSAGKERALSLAAYALKEAIISGEAIGMRGAGEEYPVSAAGGDKLAMLARLALHE